ncbi:MAG: stage II sporulation protein R [Firmicutes bacterium]|nr:stage II sporulation protein R [Bacillota bacterium]
MKERKNKARAAWWIFLPLCLLGLLLGASADRVLFADASAEEKPLRLHVLANSDSLFDQQLKLELRDHVVWLLQEDMEGAAHKGEAIQRLEEKLPVLEEACNAYLAGRCKYQARLFIQRDDFPEIDYDGMTFAAGEYDALRIVLGEGAGHNWWCVLFPPLCFVDMAGEFRDTEAVEVMAGYPEYEGQSGFRIEWKLGQLFRQIEE